MKRVTVAIVTLVALSLASGVAGSPETVKIGVIAPMTGPFQSTGRQLEAGVRLYLQENGSTFAGREVEIILKDDAGVPDNAKRLAQELITQDKANVLVGFGLTPIALAVAPLAAQAKIPQIVTVASTSIITEKSPYIVRTIQTIPQIANLMGQWAAKEGIQSVVTVVSDYGPGHDAETWFDKAYTAGGGRVLDNARVPLANPDFAPFLQRVRDAAPDALFAFVPAGVGGIFVRQFVERGLDKSGIKFIAMSDVMDDDLLNGMGDVVKGVVTAGPYSAAHPSETNRKFVAAFKAANKGARPNIVAVSAYDAMHLIAKALEATKGSADGTALVEAMKGMKWESPRGPVSIDPNTRDIVQNIYIRTVERVDGELYNVEFSTIEAVRDPEHDASRK